MDKQIILITGASGFIGRALTKRLGRTYRVIGLDRSPAKDDPDLAASYRMDLGDDASVATALEQVRSDFGSEIAACIHLAAYFDITGESNPLYEKVNVEGSRRLITALQAFDIEQFIYASLALPSIEGRCGTGTAREPWRHSGCIPAICGGLRRRGALRLSRRTDCRCL